jgi:hypothetical protein
MQKLREVRREGRRPVLSSQSDGSDERGRGKNTRVVRIPTNEVNYRWRASG